MKSNFSEIHPYKDGQIRRYSLEQLQREIVDKSNYCCPGCHSKNSIRFEEIETFPVLSSPSTATLLVCASCGTRAELSYSIAFKMVELSKSTVVE